MCSKFKNVQRCPEKMCSKFKNVQRCPEKICSKLTGEHTCRSVISIKLQSHFIEIALRHGSSAVNLVHIVRTPFPKNNSERLLIKVAASGSSKPELETKPVKKKLFTSSNENCEPQNTLH